MQQRRRACSLLCQRRLAHPRPSRLLADVYMYCAPTRGAFHTGRFPMHLDAVQKNLIPWSMPAGIDLRYEFMPAVLKKAGYQTHHIGKWHQGFFTEAYTPLKRGYDSTFGFLVGGEVRVAALLADMLLHEKFCRGSGEDDVATRRPPCQAGGREPAPPPFSFRN